MDSSIVGTQLHENHNQPSNMVERRCKYVGMYEWLLRNVRCTLCRRRKWLAGNFIREFISYLNKVASFVRTRMKSRLDFPENVISRSPFSPFCIIFRHHSQQCTLYENVTFSYPTRVLAHTVPLCNGPWTNIDQQLVYGLPRPATKRHKSLKFPGFESFVYLCFSTSFYFTKAAQLPATLRLIMCFSRYDLKENYKSAVKKFLESFFIAFFSLPCERMTEK